MITITITETVREEVGSSLLTAHYVEFPRSGSTLEVYSLEIIGWVLSKRAPLTHVRVENGGDVVAKVTDFIERPDVAQAFPDAVHLGKMGFRTVVNMIGIQGEFELVIKAEFTDGSHVTFSRIRGKRSALGEGSTSYMQPLMITTLGRTGSTWLTHLLGTHPEIITYRPFKSEPRVCTYWAQILLTLGKPASYMQMLAADLSDEFWWLGTTPLPLNLLEAEPKLLQELGATSIRKLASFCRKRIEGFYLQVGEIQGKRGPRYFGEKISPDLTPLVIRDLYPDAKEIILIRDFRDMLCSIIAYSAKLGFTGFGATGFANRAHYVWKLRTDVMLLLSVWRSRGSRVHLVRYEDLIQKPEETMADVFRHLDVAHSEADMAKFFRDATHEVDGSSSHRTSVDSAQSIGRWRTELDTPLQAVCLEAFGDILVEFGYSLD